MPDNFPIQQCKAIFYLKTAELIVEWEIIWQAIDSSLTIVSPKVRLFMGGNLFNFI